MKLFLISFVLLLLSFTSTAQLEKQTWLFGGTGNFSSSNFDYRDNSLNTSQKSTSLVIQLSPKVGFFVLDKLALGIKPSIAFEKAEGGDVIDGNGNIIAGGGSSKITRFDIGPFVRYYFLQKERMTNVFTEAAYQYGSEKGLLFKNNRNTFSLNAGVEVFLNTSVGLEFTLGYLYKNEKNNYQISQTQNSIQAGIGFLFHLQKFQ